MKHKFIYLFLLLAAMVSCKKEISNHTDFLSHLKTELKDRMPAAYSSLNMQEVVVTKMDSSENLIVRIGWNQQLFQNYFLLLEVTPSGQLIKGRRIGIQGNVDDHHQFHGTIVAAALNGTVLRASEIVNGYIKILHGDASQRTHSLEDPYRDLPEVVVTGYYPSSGGINWSTWYSLVSLFMDDNYTSTGGGYYSSGAILYSTIDGGGGSGGIDNGGGIPDQPIYIDYENQYANEAIDLEKYMKCFTAIPDAGASGSIEIFSDIPVDGDPSQFFDWSNGSPGHTFIQLRKWNGTQLVSQNIGFYPQSGWKTAMTPAPIDGKWVDNQGHSFNASYIVNLSAAQVQTAVTRILYLSHFVKYDIDDYNCTDWALDVFNATVSPAQELDIPRYAIPGGQAPNGTSTPNGLYRKLEELKNAGGTEAPSINIPLLGIVGQSHGACD